MKRIADVQSLDSLGARFSHYVCCIRSREKKRERRFVRGARVSRDAVRCASLREEFICNRKRPICTAGHQGKTRSIS